MKIIVVTEGPGKSLKTWSGVPYYFIRSMEELGHEVINVDVAPKIKIIKAVLQLSFKLYRNIFCLGTLIDYNRIFMYKKWQDIKVRKIVKHNPDAKFLIYTPITPNKVDFGIHTVLLFDFNMDYTIRVLQERQPTNFEKKYIDIETEILKEFNDIFCLFKKPKEYMERSIEGVTFHLLPGHFINSSNLNYDKELVYSKRNGSKQILFIGRIHYLQGAQKLIEAVRRLNIKSEEKDYIQLNVVGLNNLQLQTNEKWLKCYGYLNKDDDTQRDTYYNLIKQSKVIVNSTYKWGGITSIAEALWYGMPVITTKYDEFIDLFGDNINFGYFVEPNDVDDLSQKINNIISLNENDYLNMERNAFEAVKDFEWTKYVSNMLDSLKSI